jgi:hypothetical protein
MQRLPENLSKTLAKRKSRSEEHEEGICVCPYSFTRDFMYAFMADRLYVTKSQQNPLRPLKEAAGPEHRTGPK